MAARGPQNGRRGLERGLPLGFGARKIDDGEKEKKRKKREKNAGEKGKNEDNSGHYVIASSLPPERLSPNDDRWNAARSCQKEKKKGDYSGHYVIASSRPPERRPLERRPFVPIKPTTIQDGHKSTQILRRSAL